MNRQSPLRALIVVVAIHLLAVFAVRAAGGGNHSSGVSAAPNGVTVEFDRVVHVPDGLQKASLSALAKHAPDGLRHEHYTATVLETSGAWAHVVLIPTSILDSNWTLPLAPDDAIDIVASRGDNGAWQAVVKSEATLPALQDAMPSDFMDLTPAEPEESFLFPWTAGQSWRVSQGWHSSAIDFFPLAYSNPPVDGAILAMGTGSLSQVCNDGAQAHLRIDHGSVNSGYLHLDANTLRAHDLNQIVPRGRFLGVIYDGEDFFDPNPYCAGGSNLQYATPCGCGTGAHVHFSSSDTGITVDGFNLHAVGSSDGTYVSTNVRDEGPPPPAPGAVTTVKAAAIAPAYTEECGSGWERIDGFEGASAYLTLNTNQTAQSTNGADWIPDLPQRGRYHVAAYIPNHGPIYWGCGTVDRTISADTTDARYQITHAGGNSTVSANQAPVADQWLPLGTFRFNQGATGRVRLTDLNTEDNLSRTVSFSAMRFVLQRPDVPTGVAAGDGAFADRVRVTWSAAYGATGYDVYRARLDAGPVRIGSSTTLAYEDTTADAGVIYTYSVKATNPAGASGFSAADGGSLRGPYAAFLPSIIR